MSGYESAAGRSRRALALVLGLTLSYMLVEAVGSFLTGSLALLADAGHMLADATGLGLALLAIWFAQRPVTPQKTYGYYRTEILAALANALVVFGVVAYILYEAYRRFQSPLEVQSAPMLAIATVGLGVNLIGVYLLHRGAAESLNVQGAFLEVLSDALGSAGVIIAGLIMLTTGWWYADPLFSGLIALFIVFRAWRLLRVSLDVLLEACPSHINLTEVERAITEVPGVRAVHDLHVWTITSGFVAMSGHAVVNGADNNRRTLEELRRVLHQKFGIDHTTIQLEEEGLEERTIHN